MSVFAKIKVLLAAVIVLFIGAAMYTSFLIHARQDALEEYSRYNVAWLVAQAAAELARFEERLSAYQVPGSETTLDDVLLRFDIIVSRSALLQKGVVLEFVQSAPEHRTTVELFEDMVAQVDTMIGDLDQPGVAEEIRNIVAEVDQKVVRLASAANRWVGDQVAQDEEKLIRLHWIFSALAAGLIFFGLVLIALLIWHNTALRRAHNELNATTEDLRSTSKELAQANQVVQDTNLELERQNKSLRERDRELRTQNDRFDAALNNMSQGLCMADSEQKLIVCNERYIEMFGIDRDRVAPGRAIREILGDRHDSELRTTLLGILPVHCRTAPGTTDGATSFIQDIGGGRTIAVAHQRMRGGGWVATYEDITERRQNEARIAHMAHHDVLTDLPNRSLFHERMEQEFASLRNHGGEFAILCLDLDRFKSVNDTLGHPVGDALLKAVAARLQTCIRESDLVARLGGDEFAILQIGPDQPGAADALAQRLLREIGQPYDLDGQQLVVSTSIGIAIAPADGETPDQLLKNADTALYRAKSDGRNTHRFFEAQMDIELQDRRLLELDLREAVDAGKLELYYQPLVNLDTNQITGCEALLRWRHPERGMIPPSQFIPVAEDVGLIGPMGEWVLREACREAAKWSSDVKVAVNLSPIQFKSSNLKETVENALAAAGLPASRLELEVTESVLLQDDDATMITLHQLRDLGIRIALDDFGTGYSSLSYLRSFPFDRIKIDRSFVQDLSSRSDCLAIVRSVATLGKSLGMQTTGEGVETAEQVRQLRQAGCTEVQGYLFGRPQPAEAIRETLREERQVSTRAA